MIDQLDLEVFRAGDYGDKGVWDEAKLDQIAADYNTQTHEAPVTLDHAQRGPALAWVAAVRRVGDKLVARLRGVSARLLELIRAGAFKKRSVELYPRLRATGRPYLRAVSFLGAAVPEVKGLADPLLPEAGAAATPGAPLFDEASAAPDSPDATPLILEMSESPAGNSSDLSDTSDTSDLSDVSDSAPQSAPSASSAPSMPSMPSMPPAAPSLPSRPALDFGELAARLRGEGRWSPTWAERGIAEFFQALAAIDEIEVGEGQCVHAAEWFAEFLAALPPVVTMQETAGAVLPPPGGGLTPATALAPAANVDPASVELHRAALAFQESHAGADYAEALRRCAARR